MGLDQNWLVGMGNEPLDADKLTSFAYHRKFNALEGFMQDEWYRQGNDKDFNCELLPITEELLDQLEAKIKADELEPTSGFFFGSTEKDEWYRKDLKELKKVVIPQAREHLREGNQVFYSSWW